jgi:hypothetical protein
MFAVLLLVTALFFFGKPRQTMMTVFAAATIIQAVVILDWINNLTAAPAKVIDVIFVTIMWYWWAPPTNAFLAIIYIIFVYHLWNRFVMTRKAAVIHALILLALVTLYWPIELGLYDFFRNPD